MRFRIGTILFAIPLMTALVQSSFAQEAKSTLQIDQYLEQVKRGNPAYKATEEASSGAKLRSTEGTLLILPQLLVEAAKAVDETEPTNANAQGVRNSLNKYSVSLLQNTTFGLSGKLSYGNNHFITDGADPAFVPLSDYYRVSPSIELSQSLWKNGFGSEVRAQRQAINAAANASYYAERAKNLGVIIEAQSTYHNLYYTQKTIAALQESMQFAQKLRTWAKKKFDQGLGEQTDYLQTKAAYELRELEFLNAQEAYKSAARAFNSLRGLDSGTVEEMLTEPTNLSFNKKQLSQTIWRDDVRAAQKEAEAKEAEALLGRERNKPTLDVYGKYAWNGLDVESSEAQDKSFKDDHPSYMVGVKLQVPLAFGKANDVTKGYKKEAVASKLSFQRKAQEQERDYNDLISKIENAQLRLKLASALEESQRIKVQAERKRHGRGRTTFFQVLTFEQDYLSAQLNKIKNQAELSNLLTQLQMYREE